MGYQRMSGIWIFPLVSEKIGSEVGQKEIFRFASRREVSQEKYFEYFYSPTHFDSLSSADQR